MENEANLVRAEDTREDRESWAYRKYIHLGNVLRVSSLFRH